MKKTIIAALRRIVGADGDVGKTFLRSGNLLNKLKNLGDDAALELADFSYERVAKEKEVFEKGYLFGRLNKIKKPVYRIEYPPYILYFRGTEADILRKIANYAGNTEEGKEKTTEDTGTQKELEQNDIDVSEKELSDIF